MSHRTPRHTQYNCALGGRGRNISTPAVLLSILSAFSFHRSLPLLIFFTLTEKKNPTKIAREKLKIFRLLCLPFDRRFSANVDGQDYCVFYFKACSSLKKAIDSNVFSKVLNALNWARLPAINFCDLASFIANKLWAKIVLSKIS